MSIESGDIAYLRIADDGYPYAKGGHIDVARHDDGRIIISPNSLGQYRILSCNRSEEDGVKMLELGVWRRH